MTICLHDPHDSMLADFREHLFWYRYKRPSKRLRAIVRWYAAKLIAEGVA